MATETIVGIATPPGRGGVGIVRISGPKAPAIAKSLVGGVPKARTAVRAVFRDGAGDALDTGLALYFPAPRSFTGEHVLEVHGHGGAIVLERVVAAVCALGARRARAGEFSERAFLNGKLDLAQAEAIADLIDSGSDAAARAALRSLAGEFSECVNSVVEQVADLRAYVEAAIDFPDEDVEFLADGEVGVRTRRVLEEIDLLAASARQGSLLRDGIVVVIAGPPNAGKSSLMNRLAGHDAAIVTDIPGTTRDVLREDLVLDGLPVRLVDTAGLREAADQVEVEGVRRARAEIRRADLVLLVLDAGAPNDELALDDELALRPVTVVRNKIDLTGERPGVEEAEVSVARVSARTGAGLDALRDHVKRHAGWTGAAGTFSARARHLDALAAARRHIETGLEALETNHAAELLAEELRLAQHALGEITGAVTTEDLLGRIFSSFCIGK